MQKIQYGEIDLLQMMLIIWRKRWLVVMCTLLTSLLGLLYFLGTSNTYSAKVSIQIDLNKSNTSFLGAFDAFGGKSGEDYEGEIELIKSRKLLTTVVERLELNPNILNDRPLSYLSHKVSEYYTFFLSKYVPFLWGNDDDQEDTSSLTENLQATKQLQKMITITHQKNSQFITIAVNSPSRYLSTKIVNTIANAYIQYNKEERKNENDGTSSWLLNELESIKSDIVRSEKDLQSFSDSKDLVDIQGVLSLKAGELKDLTRQRTDLEQTIDEHEIQYQAMIGVTDPLVLLTSATIKANPIIEKTQEALSEAESGLLEVSLKYGPKHPAYIFAKENVTSAKSLLERQVMSLITAAKVELDTEQKKLEKLESLFADAKLEFQQLSKLESMFRQKKREVAIHQELYDTVLKRLQETQTINAFDQELATVFDYALVEDAKNTSKRKAFVAISVIFGILIGSLIALISGLIGQRFWNSDELERFAQLPVLANLPKLENKNKRSHILSYYHFSKNELYQESINALRTRLLAGVRPAQIIAVTSTMPREGKSTMSLQLAQAFSELEKVIIIDGDLRNPSIMHMLGLPDNVPGLSDVLSKEAKLVDCILRGQEQGFDILSAGQYLEHSNSLLSSSMMPKLLQVLAKYYDRIIIETAPLHLFSDAEAVSKLVDGVLFVVKAEATFKRDIKVALDKLKRIEANVLGLVLNQSKSVVQKEIYQQYIHNTIEGSQRPTMKNVSRQLPAMADADSKLND